MSASNIPYDANEFTGKRILVTGETRGIGEAIVNRLIREWPVLTGCFVQWSPAAE
jgi:NAD(P)-dependent dehydrogenase (short-subunit alcohol dehydrogenase family)